MSNPGLRSTSETIILKTEAERRVRAGSSFADVARDLDIPLSTLRFWATLGNWRRRDLAFELDEERGRAALAQVAESAARELERVQQRNTKAKELANAALKALKAADPDNEGKPSALTCPPVSARQLSMTMARTLLEQGQLDEAERAARFAVRFAQAEQAGHEHESAQWRADRASILKWWENNREGFIDFHKRATEAMKELEGIKRLDNDMCKAERCPTCARPMEFWPAPMQEKMDRLWEELDDDAE